MHGTVAWSHPTSQTLSSLPFSIPTKPMDPNTTNTQNEGAPQEQLRSWGTLILFPSAFTCIHHHPVHQSVGGGGGARAAPPLLVNKALRPANSETFETMSAVTAYAPVLTRTSQVWIRGKFWHATRLSCRIPVEVLVDI